MRHQLIYNRRVFPQQFQALGQITTLFKFRIWQELSDENASHYRRSRHRASRLDMGMTFNPSKALIALVGLICMTVLIAVGAIDQDQGLPIITMVIGYAVGNGISALTNKQVEPIIKKKNQ